MSKIVHRIYAPLIARSVMMSKKYTVNNRVTHIKVRRRHIYFCTKHLFACLKLALCHTGKQIKVFLNASVTVRAVLSRFCQSTSVLSDFVRVKIINIRLAFFNKFNRTFIKEVEIIGSKINIVPLKAEPLNILFDCVNIFGVLFRWVCIVHTKITYAVVFFLNAEINANCLCVSNMEIAVWLGRKTGLDTVINALFQILIDEILNEI